LALKSKFPDLELRYVTGGGVAESTGSLVYAYLLTLWAT